MVNMEKKTILIRENSFEKARNSVNKNKGKSIIFTSDDDDLNRKVLEKLKINTLLINQTGRKDFSKQRNSGFNQVMAKATKKNNISIGINLDELISSKGSSKAGILARVRQNVALCKKNKLRMKFIGNSTNQNKTQNLKALGIVLGMHTSMTKAL